MSVIKILRIAEITTILSTLLIGILVYNMMRFLLKRRKLASITANIPGPPSLPLIGNDFIIKRIKTLEDMWVVFMDEASKYPGIGRFYLGPKLVIAVYEPKYIQAVLAVNCRKDNIYQFFRSLGKGVFCLNGKEWQDLRKPFNRIVHKDLISGRMFKSFVDKTNILSKQLETKIGCPIFDMHDFTGLCALDMAVENLFGVPLNEQENNKFDFPNVVDRASNEIFKRILRPLHHVDLIYKQTKAGAMATKLTEEMINFGIYILKERKHYVQENMKQGVDIAESYLDFIHEYGDKKNLSLEQKSALMTDALIASFDTISICGAFVFLLLAMYPEYQQKVYEEQMEIFGESDRAPEYEDVKRMSYLLMVLKDAYRLMCPPGIVKYLSQDITVDEFTFPRGCSVYILIQKVHRDPRFWDCPNLFHPDHFIPEKVKERPKYAYLPFSFGNRGCPGNFYANICLQVMVSMIIRKYRLTTNLKHEDLQPAFGLVLGSGNGYPVQIHRR